MPSKFNIPVKTPEPKKFDFKLFGAKPIPYNPKFDVLQENAALLGLSSVSAAEKLISSYLTRHVSPTTKDTPKYQIPAVGANPMQTVPGNALNGDSLFSNIEFEGITYTDFNGQTKGFQTLYFNTVLIQVRQTKNIVARKVQGSDDGEIFMYSGMGSYDITFNIIVVGDNQNGIYPQTQGIGENGVEDLIKMLESPVAIPVNNWWLQMLNISEIVIMDYEIGQSEGGISQQPITINAKSNKKASLVIQAVPQGTPQSS